MLEKIITYTDFGGTQRTEKHYFNLTRAEVLNAQVSFPGGLAEHLEKILAEMDQARIVEMFTKIIDLSYGVRSDDGRTFTKSPEALAQFKSTLAYDEFIVEIYTDPVKAAEFVNKIMPKQDLKGNALDLDKDLDKFKAEAEARRAKMISQVDEATGMPEAPAKETVE